MLSNDEYKSYFPLVPIYFKLEQLNSVIINCSVSTNCQLELGLYFDLKKYFERKYEISLTCCSDVEIKLWIRPMTSLRL